MFFINWYANGKHHFHQSTLTVKIFCSILFSYNTIPRKNVRTLQNSFSLSWQALGLLCLWSLHFLVMLVNSSTEALLFKTAARPSYAGDMLSEVAPWSILAASSVSLCLCLLPWPGIAICPWLLKTVGHSFFNTQKLFDLTRLLVTQ